MNEELHELIRDARKDLRKASGIPLSLEEQAEELRKAALAELEKFMLRRLGFGVVMSLHAHVIWTEKGPAVTLDAEGHIFHVRKATDNESYLFFIEGKGEREIARIDASDANFASRVLVAIGDAVPIAE
jgi:hypothetical protein